MTKFLSLFGGRALQLICVAGRCEIYLLLNGGAREFNCLARCTRNIIALEEDEGCFLYLLPRGAQAVVWRGRKN